jgi:serine/threonine protein kinase
MPGRRTGRGTPPVIGNPPYVRLRKQVSDLRLEIDHTRHHGLGNAATGSVTRVAALPPSWRSRIKDRLRRLIWRRPADPRVQESIATRPAVAALLPGRLFAQRYEILEVVGSGGMGRVYKAFDRKLGEDIAIKVIHPHLLTGGSTFRERFRTEIRLTRRISHQNVVRTHDLGEYSGVSFVTMEYVEGITLRELIATSGHVGVSATLAVAGQLARALEAAHEHGVIHRDIKPENLLLDRAGVLKVMDFGIARLVEHADALTQAGALIGTPAYMSPEQVLDGPVDVRSDLYGTGVVLYECLTGRLPIEAKSPISLIAKLLHEEPRPPSALNSKVPPALSALVMRLLAKKADDRPRSAAELGDLLSQIT